MSLFPKTVLLGINMHGEIPIQNTEPIYQSLKIENMIHLHAVSCGVPNVATYNSYNEFIEKTKKYIKGHSLKWDSELSKDHLSDYTKKIKKILEKANKSEQKEILNKHLKSKTMKRKRQDDTPEFVKTGIHDYVHSLDKSYSIKSFEKGEMIPNKIFYKFTEKELEGIANKEEIEIEDVKKTDFNTVLIYNMNKSMNLFDLIESFTGNEMNQVSLFELIDFFSELNVQNIIIIDLSCNVFKDIDNKTISPRTKRVTRRNMDRS